MRQRDFMDKRQVLEMRFPVSLRGVEAESFMRSHVCGPYAPPAPPVGKSTRIITLGSCFAGNVAQALAARDYDIIHYTFSERLFTTFATKEFFASLRSGEVNPVLLDDDPRNASRIDDIRASLTAGCTTIMTLGMSMCWYERETGRMIHDPIGKDAKYDFETGEFTTGGGRPGRIGIKERLSRYEMRHTDVAENAANLDEVVRIIRSFNENNIIILTLSPVPLHWCQSDYPIIPADCLSKSVLRLAIEDVMRKGHDGVYYFPSFEIVRWAMPHFNYPAWGMDDGEARHVTKELIKLIIRTFESYFVAA